MDLLSTVTLRAGASQAENRAAAQVVQERLLNPYPGVTIISSIADLGKRNRNTLELTTQPAIESVETALVVDGKKATNTFLAM
jgi:hypothetical protein